MLGTWIYTRWVPGQLKPQFVGWLAVDCDLPLVLLAGHPALAGSVALIAGERDAVHSVPDAGRHHDHGAVPDAMRGRVSGLTSTALVTAQEIGIMAAGPRRDTES